MPKKANILITLEWESTDKRFILLFGSKYMLIKMDKPPVHNDTEIKYGANAVP